MSSGLLELPRELRNLIYDHLSELTESDTSREPLSLDILPIGVWRDARGSKALLSVNHMLRAEAREHLHRCHTYLVSQKHFILQPMQYYPPCNPNPCIPRRAERLYLRIHLTQPRNDSSSSEPQRSSPNQEANWAGLKLSGCLTLALRSCHNLRDLVVLFNVRGHGVLSHDYEGGAAKPDPYMAHALISAVIKIVDSMPRMQRYAIVVAGKRCFVRCAANERWPCEPRPFEHEGRYCEINGKTCHEDVEDLHTSLADHAKEEWVSA